MTQVQPHYERAYTYDTWMESTGIPIRRGFYIEDLRTVPVGWWKERECNAAFIQLDGMQGVCENRVSEIREKFAQELTKKGTDSLMPEEAYQDRNYRWSFRGNYAAPVT